MAGINRIFVEKKPGFDTAAAKVRRDLRSYLGLDNITKVRLLIRYDVEGIDEEDLAAARFTVFAEAPVDLMYEDEMPLSDTERVFGIEYLPGQYDQCADSAAQCIQMLTRRDAPLIRVATIVAITGGLSEEDMNAVKSYMINEVDSREASLARVDTLRESTQRPPDVAAIEQFNTMNTEELRSLAARLGLAMSLDDLAHCQRYFARDEQRDPTLTEIRMLDTYWSDHCRHTTFLTELRDVEIADGHYAQVIRRVFDDYLALRREVHGEEPKARCLMDIATIAMKAMRQSGRLEDLEVSDEINACSIVVEAAVDDRLEEWLVMFKNETHNHPTEIEPFGGAATCVGGAIRDPLSGRSYVYQAMRVTGSGDPRAPLDSTLPGKLPQRKIGSEAAHGFSSYGNQIGLATGHVREIYHPGYIAKRMEIGAVVGAAPRKNVVREQPLPGDVILLVGGRTGRDGCGGATGSSKEHSDASIKTAGAEVQKGNPPTERKIQRLFRDPELSRMIKKCNDFGAGGVSVAIGELAEGVHVDLDAVPKKYDGLDGTELAISESQERMAVLVAPEDAQPFIDCARRENLEATSVAKVSDDGRVRFTWRGTTIVDLSRAFLDTNGVRQQADVLIAAPAEKDCYFHLEHYKGRSLGERWLAALADINVCSQKGLVEMFDSSIGAASVLMPFGGSEQQTPAETMVASLPVLEGSTTTGTIMSQGFNPQLASWSPFHGALFAVVDAVAKVAAVGGNHRGVRLTLQEYFEKLGRDPERWGKPLSALLGALHAQQMLGIPAIGGKDSMSGTFEDLDVPPTLVAFALCPVDVRKVISPEFKRSDSTILLLSALRDERELPDFPRLQAIFDRVHKLCGEGRILAMHTVGLGGVAAAISKMAFGNRIGFRLAEELDRNLLFRPDYGSLICEIPAELDAAVLFADLPAIALGTTCADAALHIADGESIAIEDAYQVWSAPLEPMYPTQTEPIQTSIPSIAAAPVAFAGRHTALARPRVLIPVFPGTNCEYDSARAFTRAGAEVETFIVNNLTPAAIDVSLSALAAAIDAAQIIMLPGGFSAGDEPDGSGKFIAAVFRNPAVNEAVNRLLQVRDGLMLGICNGFQALIKLGLLPFGSIGPVDESSPTLTFNTIGRHVSTMVQTRISSVNSPWLQHLAVGDIHRVPVSHGEGRFVASDEMMRKLIQQGQIATQYVDRAGKASMDIRHNPNASMYAVEGLISPDGRVFGKMAHSERIGPHVAINVPGNQDQRIFEAGVAYFS